MNYIRLNITLPSDLTMELKRKVPIKKRSKFIAEALKDKLKKKSLKAAWIKSIKANQEYYKKVAEEWKHVDAEAFEKLP